MLKPLPILVVCTSIFLAFSCGKEKNKRPAPSHVWKNEIQLSDAVTDEGCLSIPRLYAGMRGINPDKPVVILPTAISFESELNIRDNFRKLISYSQLVITEQPFSYVQNLPPVTQEACTTLTVEGTDGVTKNFTIKSNTPESLAAEAEDGERLAFTWLSPQSIQLKRRYLAYDVPCGSDQKPIFITLTKTLDWHGGGVPPTVPESGSPLSIEGNFLSWTAQAVGDDPAPLVLLSTDGVRKLDIPKIIEMTQKTPRPEIISCSGVVNPSPPGH